MTTANRPVSWREQLSTIFTGNLAHYRDKLVLPEDEREVVSGCDLLRPHVFDSVIARFGAQYPGGDRRAVVSLWSQWYFSTLLIPSVAAILLLDRILPLPIDGVGVVLDEEKHHPVAFRLPHSGHAAPRPDPFERFHALVRCHLAPLITAISRSSGLSPRLLWSNAGGYFEWTVRELASRDPATEAAAAGERFLQSRAWPDGWRNPLFEPVRYVDEEGERVCRRRICCLRYLLPGMNGCGNLCPLARVRSG